jgi:hypothetical protein
MMKKVQFIPSDDLQTNHTLHDCSCQPVITKKVGSDGEDFLEVAHRYTDNKGYIKKVCKELNISTPKFSYIQISQESVDEA